MQIGAPLDCSSGDVGVITEIDYAEAFRPLYILRWVFWGLFGLLALSAAAIFAICSCACDHSFCSMASRTPASTEVIGAP